VDERAAASIPRGVRYLDLLNIAARWAEFNYRETATPVVDFNQPMMTAESN
jgi:hypothetical protein